MRLFKPNRRVFGASSMVARRSLLFHGINMLLVASLTFAACLARQYWMSSWFFTQAPAPKITSELTVPRPTLSVAPTPLAPKVVAPRLEPANQTSTTPIVPRQPSSAEVGLTASPIAPMESTRAIEQPPQRPDLVQNSPTPEASVDVIASPPLSLEPTQLDSRLDPNFDLTALNTEGVKPTSPSPAPEEQLPALASPPQPEIKAFVAPNAYLGKVVRKVAVAPSNRLIALTFDDGPWPKSTPEVLDILKKHQIKATFFWIGLHLERYPKIAQQVVADGHVIGNHTWHHLYKLKQPSDAATEIEHTAQLMETLTGVKTNLFRPPGGHLENGLAAYAEEKLHHTVVLWSVMPADTNPKLSASDIVDKVLQAVKPGGIVLLHDGGGDRKNTIKALPKMITALEKQGYRFVTIPELLEQATDTPEIATHSHGSRNS